MLTSPARSSQTSQAKYAERRKWARLLQAVKLAADRVEKLALGGEQDAAAAGDDADDAQDAQPGASRSTKRRRTLQTEIREAWHQLRADAETIERQVRLHMTLQPRVAWCGCLTHVCSPFCAPPAATRRRGLVRARVRVRGGRARDCVAPGHLDSAG